jgi:PAS domain S-box-containing protein
MTMDRLQEPHPVTPVSVVSTDAQQFAFLVASVREYAIYMLGPDGVVRTWNSGGERIKGYSAAEIVGRHFSQMFTAEDRAAGKPQALLARAERDGACRDDGWRLRKDGTKFWASVLITALRDGSGRLTGFAKVSRDETERHAVEETVRRHAEELEAAVQQRTRELEQRTRELTEQAANLQRANEELEQFNYLTSHDLQEPIRMVGMNMQRLSQQGQRLSEEQRQRCIRYAMEGAERMRLLIDDLLRYNHIERDQEAPRAIDAGQALRSALDNLSQLITARKVEVTAGQLPTVRANPQQMTQLFQNLLENAIKYGPEERPTVQVTAAAVPEGWRFSVRDNGIGIEPAYHEKVFAVFQRLHARDRYPGTGMGLAICRKIVARHGGRIWVESAPGAGAIFHFTIPGVSP